MDLEFYDRPDAFLDAAGGLLAAEPVLGSVVAAFSERIARELAGGRDSWTEAGAPFDRWWLVVRDDGGRPISAAMRTAPFKPWPSYSLPMSDEAAALLAGALHARGEVLGGCNGAQPGAGVLAAETARLAGGAVTVDKHTRLWEATSVTPAPAPEGALRPATEADADLALDWFRRFHDEADEQAGREPHEHSGEHITRDSVLVRIGEGVVWLWELPGGEVAHLTGGSLPSFGVARLGPVYTPRQHRGRGIASHVVGELTRRGLAAGPRMCLFTDQANPTSNKIYEALGYRPVTDMAEHLVDV
jgi:GNAT superfamily N-acetyltransferase